MPDDAAYARRIASSTGTELHEIEMSQDIVQLLPRLVQVLDEPIGDPAPMSILLMCEAARAAGSKVLLGGFGADELFGGNRELSACLLADRYRRLPHWARRSSRTLVAALPVAVGERSLRYPRWAKRFLTFADLAEEPAFRRSATLFDPDELRVLLSPELDGDVDDLLAEHFETYCDNYLPDRVNRMCLASARMSLPGLILAYTDRASMAVSTEVRLPFVDPVVFRAAFSVTGNRKMQGTKGKLALKEAARAWLPSDVINRPTNPFCLPLRRWLRGGLRQVVDDVLLNGNIVSTGFVQRDALAKLIAQDRAGKQDRSKQIWQLLTLELWYQATCKAGVGL